MRSCESACNVHGLTLWRRPQRGLLVKNQKPGAPNENLVQNHFDIALLTVFKYLNGRYRHIFSPKNFSSVRIS